MVYYQDGSIDIIYTRDLLQFLQAPTRFKSPRDLPILEHVAATGAQGGQNRYATVAQAKTQQSSMLMHIKESEVSTP